MYEKKKGSCSSSSLTSIFAHTLKTMPSPFPLKSDPKLVSWDFSCAPPHIHIQLDLRGFQLLKLQKRWRGSSASFGCTDLHLQVSHEAMWWIHSGDLLPAPCHFFSTSVQLEDQTPHFRPDFFLIVHLPTHPSIRPSTGDVVFPWHQISPDPPM